jgi:hypothetical protein
VRGGVAVFKYDEDSGEVLVSEASPDSVDGAFDEEKTFAGN